MKVVILSTYDINGGAAIAAYRLMQSLENEGIDVKMLVAVKQSEHSSVVEVSSLIGNRLQKINLALEKAFFYFKEKDNSVRFQFSTAQFGYNLVQHPEIQTADIIHIHWTLQGFLSLKGISDLQNQGKKIIWTLHDMWTFTGGCHYAGSCQNYLENCGNCPFLKQKQGKDLSQKIWEQKKEVFRDIYFVTCSNWLKEKAENSSLLQSFPVQSIPNPIDTEFYKPHGEKKLLREHLGWDENKKYILFGAASISDKRKGIIYFLQALELYRKTHEELPVIVLYGGQKDIIELDGYDVLHLGYLNQIQLRTYYQACDFYAITSLEDNLPNTVMESLACGLPVLSFDTGGIPEMVKHTYNGYIAEYMSTEELNKGLDFLLNNTNITQMAMNSRIFCLENFSEEKIAGKYIAIYIKLLNGFYK